MFEYKIIPISNIMVNPDNPRFKPVLDQDHATQIMINQEGTTIKKLAVDIVKNDLNPIKRFVVLAQNKKYIMLEGNR